jgi:hypothetical protein
MIEGCSFRARAESALLGVLLGLASCSKPSARQELEGAQAPEQRTVTTLALARGEPVAVASVASPAPSADPAAPSASSPVAPPSPPPRTPGPCVFASGYRGTVAGLPVFARLGKTPQGVQGRYFYERVGTDIALRGKLAPDGAITLTETTNEGKVTGTFEGTCDGAGVVTGMWKGGKQGAPFMLLPVPQGDTPVVAKKRYVFSKKAPPEDEASVPSGMTECTYKEERDELFGLRNPAAERAINGQGLEVRSGPVIDPEEEKNDAERCEQAIIIELTSGLTSDPPFRELATIQQGGYLMAAGTAHPTNFLDYGRGTFDLRTGKRVEGKDVFARDPSDVVTSCIERQWPDGGAVAVDMVVGGFRGQFDMTAKGIHFWGGGYAHAFGALTGQGPTLSYAVLLRDGYLKATSPIARAWAGVARAANDVDPCDGAGWE